MRKTALLFAGQGAQCIGMGRDLSQVYPTGRRLFEQADEILGYDLSTRCFSGPEEELTQTEHAQPAIYLVGWIAFQLLREQCPELEFQATAGLSLGEFTALTAAGSLAFADGLRLVQARGRFMQEACEVTEGAMAAIIGLEEALTREVCQQHGVQLANLNCPGQLVISGAKEHVLQACDSAKAAGAKRALPLPVAGAYHSPLMATAQAKLREELNRITLHPTRVPVLSNVTARPHEGPASIADRLVEQVTASVHWEKGIRYLLAEGYNRFIELGPGKALSGFMKRIDRDVEVLNVGDVASLEATVLAITGCQNGACSA